jgi:NAD(P)-dependent dehydrogenase (short-subunit alcohol dehydrogenase family)
VTTTPVAIVTGASRGIGAATARRLAADGMAVVLAARSADDLAALAAGIAADAGVAHVVPTDVTDMDALDTLVAAAMTRFGRIDVLVNNAGMLPKATRAERMMIDDWRLALDLNLTGPWYLACRAKEAMAGGGRGGVIVNVTSTAALYPSVGFSAYNASKAALSMVTRTLALEWASEGVRVVGVAPGKVDTALVAPILAYSDKRQLPLNPMGRIGEPGEVAALIAYLVSERAAYMTGSIVTIDGGEVLASGSDQTR